MKGQGPGGKQSYISARDYLANRSMVTVSGSGVGGAKGFASAAAAGQPAQRKSKKAEVFVGSGRSSDPSHSGASTTSSREVAGPSEMRAKLALNLFCAKFVWDCYGPVRKSLKNEFRRESNRLKSEDEIDGGGNNDAE